MIKQGVNFYQSTKIEDDGGLLAQLLQDLMLLAVDDLFTPTIVVVPNHALASWLRDKITLCYGICSNIEFSVSLSPFLNKVYLANNQQAKLFDFGEARFIIYRYLCEIDLFQVEFADLRGFLLKDDHLEHARAFQLASQLHEIFQEYIYLRTDDLVYLKFSQQLNNWQKLIWQYLILEIGEKRTYLDVYKYYMESNVKKLPAQIYIFAANIYPSQLAIIQKLSKFMQVNWYSLAISAHYYGDLLSNSAKSKLEKKILREPYLTLDDLYLVDGNPLVANLAQQSREFNELLLMYDLDIQNDLSNEVSLSVNSTLLDIIQYDVRELQQRIHPDYQLSKNSGLYSGPLKFNQDDQSIKVNVCYNKMREVQVLFNELCDSFAHDDSLQLQDVIILAPNISDYAPYINAVFSNESARDENGNVLRFPYTISGEWQKSSVHGLEFMRLILNIPYHLPVSCLLELISQDVILNSLDLSVHDTHLIKTWLRDNAVHFGYDEADYTSVGYKDTPVGGFRQFLLSMVLGLCMPDAIMFAANTLPLYGVDDTVPHACVPDESVPHTCVPDASVPYDNIENSQIDLCKKLFGVIECMLKIRDALYLSKNVYKVFSIATLVELISQIRLNLKLGEDLLLDSFLGNISLAAGEQIINLPIVNALIDSELKATRGKMQFRGKITFASMEEARYIPSKIIYIMGLNFSDYPRKFNPNKLSVLSNSWSIADRNYNIEDKQIFLDVILSAQQKLYFSYVGRNENSNDEIRPSTVLGLFLDTVRASVLDGDKCLDTICVVQPLHPFYKNDKRNYSVFWQALNGKIGDFIETQSWDFQVESPITLAEDRMASFLSINCNNLINTLLYTNVNLYRVLNLNNSTYDDEISDNEPLDFFDTKIAKKLYKEFEHLSSEGLDLETLKSQGTLTLYLQAKGILAYATLGKEQLEYYYQIHHEYKKINGAQAISVNFASQKYAINLVDEVLADGNTLVICEGFASLRDTPLKGMLEYSISLPLIAKSLLYCLLSKYATFSDANGERCIDRVELRLMSRNLDKQIYTVELQPEVDSAMLMGEILNFYVYSLTNPVLVHPGAVSEYIAIDLTSDVIADVERKRIAAVKTYGNSFSNLGLEKLRNDIIFAGVADEYFTFMPYEKNTLFKIAELLDAVKLT